MNKTLYLYAAFLLISTPVLSQNKRPALSQLDFEEGAAKTPRNVEPKKSSTTPSVPFQAASPPITSPISNYSNDTTPSAQPKSVSNEPLNSFLEAQNSLAETVKEKFKEVESLIQSDGRGNNRGNNSFSSPARSNFGHGRSNNHNTNRSSRMHREKGRGVPVLKDRPKNVGVPIL